MILSSDKDFLGVGIRCNIRPNGVKISLGNARQDREAEPCGLRRLDYYTAQERVTVKAAPAFTLALTVTCSCATGCSQIFHLVS